MAQLFGIVASRVLISDNLLFFKCFDGFDGFAGFDGRPFGLKS